MIFSSPLINVTTSGRIALGAPAASALARLLQSGGNELGSAAEMTAGPAAASSWHQAVTLVRPTPALRTDDMVLRGLLRELAAVVPPALPVPPPELLQAASNRQADTARALLMT